jgi:hypothetical protein
MAAVAVGNSHVLEIQELVLRNLLATVAGKTGEGQQE